MECNNTCCNYHNQYYIKINFSLFLFDLSLIVRDIKNVVPIDKREFWAYAMINKYDKLKKKNYHNTVKLFEILFAPVTRAWHNATVRSTGVRDSWAPMIGRCGIRSMSTTSSTIPWFNRNRSAPWYVGCSVVRNICRRYATTSTLRQNSESDVALSSGHFRPAFDVIVLFWPRRVPI